ncbi:antibiotic biosynthesis monooxygenase family protein [Thermopolyspora sp. NPDC052614]|uniref:antibiotic biosynthesis monooxygenase family protein n=1 Tax=Thermopolyspora sp. NPDC052614 TaxID=3155682 RepID=UPI003412826F
MILEIARITLKPGRDEEFLKLAADQGRTIFEEAGGCAGMQLRKSVESADQYIMLVRWRTLDDHLVRFRASEGLRRWRELTADLYAAPVRIENFTPAFDGFGVEL